MSSYVLLPPPAADRAPVELDEDQRRVVAHREGPLLVLAGPGTGKTTTVVELVARRLSEGLDPARALVLTFSRKAAVELRERLALRVGPSASGVRASTFHSYALSVLTEHQASEPGAPRRRLMGAPEQELQLRTLLIGRQREDVEMVRGAWPDELRPALGTVGLASEVRAWAGRLAALGLAPEDVSGLQGSPSTWRALADLVAELEQVQDSRGLIDYGALVTGAADQLTLHGPGTGFDLVVVDEFQDTDPAQERLLRRLVGESRHGQTRVRQGSSLVVVGDPDQSIYGFRGADPRILKHFTRRFAGARGEPAAILALRHCRRSPSALVELSRRVIAPVDVMTREHRDLVPLGEGGEVGRHLVASAAAEASLIADLLRNEHLRRGTPWSHMAVLVRSAVRDLPRLSQALAGAGVPVEVSGDELPLAQDPVAQVLLGALRVVGSTEELTPDLAVELLIGPLGGLDAIGARGLLRALRRRATDEGRPPGAAPDLLAQTLRAALAGAEGPWRGITAPGVGPARQLVTRLLRARAALDARGGAVEDALWQLWSGSDWQTGLEQSSASGGRAGRSADRDLDVVVGLFSAVRRFAEGRGGVGGGIRTLIDELESYDLPALPDRAEVPRSDAVRLLTAHRSKGLEWEVVVVAGVQEGSWPDVRLRSSVTGLDCLAVDTDHGCAAVQEPPDLRARLDEERRLFYVAVTRARRRLVLTAVDGGPDDQVPSRFLREARPEPGADEVEVAPLRTRSTLDLSSVVARLRTIAAGDAPDLAHAAAARLAALAVAREGGVLLAPDADPDRWWAARPPVPADRPLFDDGQAIVLSPSSLDAVADCSLRWFLRSQARAQVASSTRQTFGSLIHAIAESVQLGEIPADPTALAAFLDEVWPSLGHETGWHARAERELAEQMLARFLLWHNHSEAREVVGVEVPVALTTSVAGGDVTLRGRIDRLERDADGALVVVDLKTGADDSRPQDHIPLAVYQWMVERVEEAWAAPASGAELLQLKFDALAKGPALGVRVRRQPAVVDLDLAPTQVIADAVAVVRGERLVVTRGEACQFCDFLVVCPAQPDGRQVV